jgi:predicted regulator of Ras-like GTPase activity (Roadblock/LC7/MglB family)
MAPFANRSVTPASPTGLTGHANGNTNGYGNGHVHESTNGHGQTGTPGLRLGPLNGSSHAGPSVAGQTPAPAPLTSFPSAPQTPPQPAIFVNLIDLCDSWPESLKVEIQTSSLAQANIPLDGNIVVPGMKRGRVVMFWKQLRLLAQPASPASPHDHLELELPLKVLTPLFLASQKNLLRPKYRGQLSTDIPDLFFGFPQPAPAAPVAPTPIAPAAPAAPVVPPLAAATPTASPVVPPLPKSMEKVQDTNFYVWGENGEVPLADEATLRRAEVPQTDFMSRQTHPKEIVGRAMALPGVAGSVVAMPDGMRIASQVPVELNADTVAAFLPQIFDRVNQSTRELRMGPLNNVNFTVGNVPWKIFRVNAVYFATFGRAGEQLPSAQLAQLAAELDRKK